MQEQPTTPPAKLQAYVQYLTGSIHPETTLLEWSADDRIKLFKMDYTTTPPQAKEVYFDVPVNEIKQVGGAMYTLKFVVGEKKYHLLFSRTGVSTLLIPGLPGLAAASAALRKSGVPAWLEQLKKNGVPTKGYIGFGWVTSLALVAVGLIIVITVVMYLMNK